MTSRTTKQAARAYQKAHEVPYTEALRHVMETETPLARASLKAYVESLNAIDRLTEEDVHAYQKAHGVSEPEAVRSIEAEVVRRVTENETSPAETPPRQHTTGNSGLGPFIGKQVSAQPQGPVYFDIHEAPHLLAVGEPSVGKTTHATGQPGYGSTIGARPRQAISFGEANTTKISSLFDRYDPIPVSWSPWQAKVQGNPPNLGVYGPHGHGKTVFLATLANRYKHAMPITVVTAFPEAYPDDDRIKIISESPERVFSNLEGLSMQTLDAVSDWSQATGKEHSTSESLPLLLIDNQPSEREELNDLRRFLRSTRHHGIGVVYTGPEDHGPHPDLASCTDVALVLHRQRGNWIWKDSETPLELLEPFPSEPFTGRN